MEDVAGSTVVVTGATGGIGFFTALQLAERGVHVVVTGRDPERIAAALRAIRALVPGAEPSGARLDTADLASLPGGAAKIAEAVDGRVDALIGNAGITTPPKRRESTPEGHERTLATNALGHFVLAGALLPALAAAAEARRRDARIVWLGSLSTGLGRMDPVDLELEHGYTAWRAYTQSKVVVQALGFEAADRLADAGLPIASVVAHPGWALGGRDRRIPGINEPTRRERLVDELQAAFTQSKAGGARTVVQAAIGTGVHSGDFWGPSALVKGAPRLGTPASLTTDAAVRERIWRDVAAATGRDWPIPPPGE